MCHCIKCPDRCQRWFIVATLTLLFLFLFLLSLFFAFHLYDMTPRFHFLSPRLTFALVFYSTFRYVSGDRNVTVDDSDGSISYSTGWSVSSGSNSLDFGGYHHLSDSKTATANFTFTGMSFLVVYHRSEVKAIPLYRYRRLHHGAPLALCSRCSGRC